MTYPIEEPVWRPIHYLGSKLRIAQPIREAVAAVGSGGRVLDLFAGSGTTALALSRDMPVVANDIQEYSRVICSAILCPPSAPAQSVQSIVEQVRSSAFRQTLISACEPLLEWEQRSLQRLRSGDMMMMADLAFVAPLMMEQNIPDTRLAHVKLEVVERLRRTGLWNDDRSVVLKYYGGSYFAFLQAIDLCAILDICRPFAADKDQAMAAALSCASEIVNSIGKQFAQPVKLTSKDGALKPNLARKIYKDKSIDAIAAYSNWLKIYRAQPMPKFEHMAIRGDYLEALKQSHKDVSVIYADPPYGREHYSRYYHVLETMALGDDPSLSTITSKKGSGWSTGIYRSDRHQSPFSIISKAPKAFEKLFQASCDMNATLVLSYSPAALGQKDRLRVVDLQALYDMSKKYFRHSSLTTIDTISHSKMNKKSLNSEIPTNSEALIVCHP